MSRLNDKIVLIFLLPMEYKTASFIFLDRFNKFYMAQIFMSLFIIFIRKERDCLSVFLKVLILGFSA